MAHAEAQHARNLVVMVAAGGNMECVLELARLYGVRAVHVQQLAVPQEEAQSQVRLTQALRQH